MSFFSFFSSKKNLLDTNCLDGMSDVHCHLLPDVDDGSFSVANTLEMLDYLEHEVGFKRMYFTPHVMEDFSKNNRAYLTGRFDSFSKEYKGSVQLSLASEYMLDARFKDHLDEGLFTLGGKYVLVETSYFAPSPQFNELIYEIKARGLVPMIAHPERYAYMRMQDYDVWREQGFKFQMNLMSLGGVYGQPSQEKARHFLERGWYDFVGSDLHRLSVFERFLNKAVFSSKELEAIKSLIKKNEALF